MILLPFPDCSLGFGHEMAAVLDNIEGDKPCDVWAEEHFRLPPESGSMEGPLKPWPFQRLFMNLFTGDGNPRRIIVLKSSRMGYTQAAVVASIYLLCFVRRHVSWNQPTGDDARRFSKEYLLPGIENCEPAKRMVTDDDGDKRSKMAMLGMKLGGKFLRVAGSMAATAFRGFSSDVVILDEIGAYGISAGKEGNPILLAARSNRLSPFRRVIVGSTPTITDECRITDEWNGARLKLQYAIPCPHCGERSFLEWRDIHYDGAEVEDTEARADSAHVVCRHCKEPWGHERLADALKGGRWESEKGQWVDESSGRPVLCDRKGKKRRWPRTVAIRVWSAYNPVTPWSEIVEAYFDSRGDPESEQTFENTWLGRSWSPEAEGVEIDQVKQLRMEMPDGCPPWVQFITVGVDVQKGSVAGDPWLSVLVVGWGYKDSFALLERREFHGRVDISDGEAWQDLEAWLRSDPKWGGIGIYAVGVDSGFEANTVYAAVNNLRRRAHGRIMPVKGATPLDAPIYRRGSKGGGRRGTVWHVGGHKAANFLMARLAGKIKGEDDWPRVAINADTDKVSEAAANELLAEKLTLVRGRKVWKQIAARNEILDCARYALAVRRITGHDTLDPEAWDEELARISGMDDEELQAETERRIRDEYNL